MIIVFTVISCTKLVEVDNPDTGTSGEVVFTSDQTAIGVLTGMYAKIITSNFPSGMINSISVYSSLSADDLTLWSGATETNQIAFYTNNLNSRNSLDFWNSSYQLIYIANSSIEGLQMAQTLTPAVKTQLIGEAKFMRAFLYFYLVNLYGDVPLVLSSDYSQTSMLPRTSKSQVYNQMISDLLDAQNYLSTNFLDGSLLKTTSDRVRPTKWAATALLARIYLYTEQYSKAKEASSSIIANTSNFTLDIISKAFLKNSPESIWQLQPVKNGQNTPEAWFFKLPATGPASSYPCYISNSLYSSFETNDLRKSEWIGTLTLGSNTFKYPTKYKSATLNAGVTEFSTVFRISEQYLIRAEANLKLTDTASCKKDINTVRARAGLNDILTNDVTSLQKAIMQERRVELFTEWGNRWFDLKRSGTIDSVMTIETKNKGGTWVSTSSLYPIPLTEIQKNNNLKQNEGYQ